MIQAISDKIKTILDTLKGTNKPFVSVFDYHTLENTGYPFVCFQMVDFNGEIRDTCNNERNIIFDIYILQEVKINGQSIAKEIIYKAIDDIITLFDKNYTLDGVVDLIAPIGGSIMPVILWNGETFVGTIKMNCRYNQFIW